MVAVASETRAVWDEDAGGYTVFRDGERVMERVGPDEMFAYVLGLLGISARREGGD